MSAEVPAGAGQVPSFRQLGSRQLAESQGWSAPGIRVLVVGIVMLLAGVVLLALGVSLGPNAPGPIALIWAAAVLIIAGYLAVRGLTPVVAGEARVIQLFGKYHGTIRDPGLHWVNPYARRRKVSVRIRNQETARRRAWSSWTRSGRPPWCPTCSWCCAASRRPSRSSTPGPSISD